ncbi:MAG: cold shock domain-containing protein [Anaerolineae bacterium]|nr:cold shock domain-containing protein [Anaerolineae bacterium]
MSNKMTGTVKSFDLSKGYGYIEAGDGEEVFVHYQSIIGNSLQTLSVGDHVEFAVKSKPSGPVALEVSRI